LQQYIQKDYQIKPFLRWAGSKVRLLEEISRFIPKHYNNYHEPFLGSASVFLKIKPSQKAYLYDLNENLINTYIQVRDNVDEIIRALKKLKNNEEDYYAIRMRKCKTNITKAAQFIYLNKTCFNGLYRVNPNNGNFNVPYGYRKNVDLITEVNLRAVSEALQGVYLKSQDFDMSIHKIKPNDLVFLDPPYTVAHELNGFVEYNQKIFSWEDQIRLSEYIKLIDKIGAYYILTNAAHLSIRKLYSGIAKPSIVERFSLIGGKNAQRGKVKEYIFTNLC
jgi:DNA adenine methylase